ncbi:putative Mago nashi protein [Dioscorea sansibarensis]
MAKNGGSGGSDLDEFYLSYYVGHKGKHGHEFLRFEFRSKGVYDLRTSSALCFRSSRCTSKSNPSSNELN